MKKCFAFLLVIPLTINCTEITKSLGKYDSVEDAHVTSKIVIDLSKQGQIIDKKFYGSQLDSYSKIPTKELVNELQLGKIRVGGNEYDVNNWKINKTVNSALVIKDLPSFEFLAKALSDYKVDGIFQINLTGYQPELVGQNYVIKRTFTANSAYEMVKYLNGVLKLKIVDFNLGNEFSIWNETHGKIWPTKDGIAANEYIDRYIEYALLIRKAQDEINGNPNSIKIWGPEISTSWTDWNSGNLTTDCKWTDIAGQVACSYGSEHFNHFIPYFLNKLKLAESDSVINPKKYKLLDYMSIHYYPNFRTKINDPSSVIVDQEGHQLISEMLESTRLLNDPEFVNTIDISSYRNFKPNVLGRMNNWINKYYPDAKLTMNEFAVDSSYKSNSYHPIIRPLYLADAIGIFTKENVVFLNQFLLSSDAGANLPWTMVEGAVKKDMFYMYKLFTNNFKGTVVKVEDSFGDVVNAYATILDDVINLAVVNKDPIDKTVNIYVKDGAVKKLTTYLIPAWSSSILKLQKKPGASVKDFVVFQFGAREMKIPVEEIYKKKI